MRKKLNSFLLLFILGAGFFLSEKTFAEENALSQAPFKPRSVPLEIQEVKNPFKSYFAKRKEVVPDIKARPVLREETVRPPDFQIQGIIWGGDLTQAIIDNQVLKVGDTINGAQIVDIGKGGLTISFRNKIFKIESPSQLKDSESIESPSQLKDSESKDKLLRRRRK